MIILLDGSKGAGKSSVSKLLMNRIENTVYLGIDNERRSLLDQSKSRLQKNKEAFEIMVNKSKESLEVGKTVIVDCGLTQERISIFERVANEAHSKLYKFFLKAPYDTLLERVRVRDKTSGKLSTDVERFDEIHKIVHSKSLDDFIVIETDKVGMEEASEIILKAIDKG